MLARDVTPTSDLESDVERETFAVRGGFRDNEATVVRLSDERTDVFLVRVQQETGTIPLPNENIDETSRNRSRELAYSFQ